LQHPPVVTLGRRTDNGELHVPEGTEVEVVETDRGGKSTFHGPGQLVCYPILDLRRHGKDVKKYVRDLEEALIRTLTPLGLTASRIEGLTGVCLQRPPRKIASIGVHISRWITTHGYALHVDRVAAPTVALLVLACADRNDDARPVAGADDDVVHLRRAVDEVPLPERPLLALGDENSLTLDDEEVLLIVLPVVHGHGVARV